MLSTVTLVFSNLGALPLLVLCIRYTPELHYSLRVTHKAK
jgi:hypothetical protein